MTLSCELAAQKAHLDHASRLFGPSLARFFAKVDGDWASGCWNWTAAKDRGTYSLFWGDSKTVAGHRWIYITFNGSIPEGLELDHLCVNPRCVAPSHLEMVTKAENIRRIGVRREAAARGQALTVKAGGRTVMELSVAFHFGLPVGGALVLEGRPRARAVRSILAIPFDTHLSPYSII